jgi:hypothetical protein
MRMPLSLAVLLVLLILAPGPRHSWAEGPYTSFSLFPATPCDQTFTLFDAAFTLGVRSLPSQSIAALCPSTCLPQSDWELFGSFPYHGRSSICLAAIHAGIINATAGGGVFISRFYRQDWSGSTSQTIFPYNSSTGSWSNGVQSHDVSRDWYSIPSNASEWSYVVRGRGDHILQRRLAPFPPRAGHVHLTLQSGTRGSVSVMTLLHVIVGGYNSTHYLRDCWLGIQRWSADVEDIQWSQQDDAPFSPRSHMMVRAARNITDDPLMYVVGGQTGHLCGLHELGECDNEAWRFALTNDSVNPEVGWRLTWEAEPLFHLPFSTRCQAGLIITRWTPLRGPQIEAVSIFGGQLSYNDTACNAQPVTTNDVWMGEFNFSTSQHGIWHQSEQGPFSPRRFEGNDPSPRAVREDGGQNFGRLSGPLIGGLRHLSIKRNATASPASARLLDTELSAEIWECESPQAIINERPAFDCLWSKINNSRNPSGAIAAPTAAGADQALQVEHNIWLPADQSMSFGGITSEAFIEQWKTTPPKLDESIETSYLELEINITVVTWSSSVLVPVSMDDILSGRQWLPLNFSMSESELNDLNGNYVLGSDWMTMSTLPWEGFVASSTFHQQKTSLVVDPQNSTWFVPQARPSVNTTRPRFSFPLRRHSHRSGRYATHIILSRVGFDLSTPVTSVFVSGGRSGEEFYNDFILQQMARCLPPIDPSFFDAMGPMEVLTISPTMMLSFNRTGSVPPHNSDSLQTGVGLLKVACQAGFHFEPPLVGDSETTLHCAPNGLWMDMAALTIRRCVPDELNCTVLLHDLGGRYCVPRPPIIDRVDGSYLSANNRIVILNHVDNVTLTDVPFSASLFLTVTGDVFFYPLDVTVNSEICKVVESPDSTHCVQYNISSTGENVIPVCDSFTSSFSCHLEPIFGRDMVLSVRSSRLFQRAEVTPDLGRSSATLTSMAPTLRSTSASHSGCNSMPCP